MYGFDSSSFITEAEASVLMMHIVIVQSYYAINASFLQ